MIEVLPLKGYKSLRALTAFHRVCLGYFMQPVYGGTSYEEFLSEFDEMTDAAKETFLRKAVIFCELQKEEIESLVGFAKDKNGVTYSAANVGNLDMKEIHEIAVAVCMAIGRIKVDIVSEDEKKKYRISA